jgi:hypothetical protein
VSAWGQWSPPKPLADALQFLHNIADAAPYTFNPFTFESNGCAVTIADRFGTARFSLSDIDPSMARTHLRSVHPQRDPFNNYFWTFNIEATNYADKIQVHVNACTDERVCTEGTFNPAASDVVSKDYQVFFSDERVANRFNNAFNDAVIDCGGKNSIY